MCVQGGKRPMVPKTPQPAKKPKVEAKAPKSAPAKMGKGTAATPLSRPHCSLLTIAVSCSCICEI